MTKKSRETRVAEFFGMKVMQEAGEYAILISYRRAGDIDVQFQDGTVRRGVTLSSFRKGKVKKVPPKHADKTETVARVGEKATQYFRDGEMDAECVAYRTACDIDVKFANNLIKEHVRWNHFVRGQISPKDRVYNGRHWIDPRDPKKRVGCSFLQHCGVKATCVAYRGANDIDVRFEDGVERHHKTWYNLAKGHITNKKAD